MVGDLVSEKLSWGSDKHFYVSLCQGAIPIGAAIGSHVSGYLCSHYGKRKATIFFQIVAIIGIILFSTLSTWTIIIGRLIIGFSDGPFLASPFNYISEAIPISLRKSASIFTTVMYTFGYCLSTIFSLGLPYHYTDTEPPMFWLYFMCLFQMVISIIQILGFLLYFKYETPAWLHEKERTTEYDESLEFVYYGEDIEIAKEEIEGRKKLMESDLPSLTDIFTKKQYLKMTRVSGLLYIFFQCTGVNCTVFYSFKMFQDISNDIFFSRIFSISIGLTLFFSAFFSSMITRYLGRKTLIMFYFGIVSSLNIIIGLISQHVVNPTVPILVLSIIYMFLCSSLGTIIAIYCMESVNIRIYSFGGTCNTLAISILILLFPLARQSFEIYYIFYFFGIICLIALLYSSIDLIETKGLDRQQIASLFINSK